MNDDILEELQLLRNDIKAIHNSINGTVNGVVILIIGYFVVKYLLNLL